MFLLCGELAERKYEINDVSDIMIAIRIVSWTDFWYQQYTPKMRRQMKMGKNVFSLQFSKMMVLDSSSAGEERRNETDVYFTASLFLYPEVEPSLLQKTMRK